MPKIKIILSVAIVILLSDFKVSGLVNNNKTNKSKIQYFEYKEFPDIHYLKPNVENWINQLNPIKDTSLSVNYIKAEYIYGNIGDIEIIQGAKNPLKKEKYSFYNDSIKVEFDGLSVSQPGYEIYTFTNNNLLKEKSLWISCLKTDYCRFSRFYYEYCPGTEYPKYIYNYFYMKEFAGCETNYREEYDIQGNFIENVELTE